MWRPAPDYSEQAGCSEVAICKRVLRSQHRQGKNFEPSVRAVMTIEVAIAALETKLDPLERTIRLFSASLEKPTQVKGAGGNGFRYSGPDVRHFCLLKAVKALSAMNAALVLARSGFVQEVIVLIRTIVEATRHIEFVLDLDISAGHKETVRKYMEEYFADSDRGPGVQMRREPIQQGKVHEQLGKTLDEIAEGKGARNRISAKIVYKSTYHQYSGYVHGRYPEIMDLYGGRPGQFHVHGMSGTPKDGEVLEQLAAFCDTMSTTFIIMIEQLDLRAIVEADPIVGNWYRDYFRK
jgi:hypothetical protein